MQSKPVKAEGGCSADGALAPTAEEKQWAEHTLHFPGFQPKAVAQPQSQQPCSIPGASVTFPGLLRLRNQGPHHPREHRGSQTLLGTGNRCCVFGGVWVTSQTWGCPTGPFALVVGMMELCVHQCLVNELAPAQDAPQCLFTLAPGKGFADVGPWHPPLPQSQVSSQYTENIG